MSANEIATALATIAAGIIAGKPDRVLSEGHCTDIAREAMTVWRALLKEAQKTGIG